MCSRYSHNNNSNKYIFLYICASILYIRIYVYTLWYSYEHVCGKVDFSDLFEDFEHIIIVDNKIKSILLLFKCIVYVDIYFNFVNFICILS